ncbi:MAG: dioxygenase [Hyphomicrobiaceae bacterium]
MRNVDKHSVTEAVKATFKCSDSRTELLVRRLVDYIHDYAREVNLSHAEWNKLIELLTRAGEVTDPERNEFILFSDVLGLSSLVDMLNVPEGGTSSSLLGPFHILGAPDLPVGGDMIRDNPGDQVLVYGVVRSADGEPLSGAKLEIWQTAANGLYSNQDEAQSNFNFRCRQITGPDGIYAFSTVRPAPYTVPSDGPVGELLAATGRHPWRPSHLHFIVMAEGHQSLVTELFPEDDPYLDQDAVFGVRESLILRYKQHQSIDEIPVSFERGDQLSKPFYSVNFDFKLASA